MAKFSPDRDGCRRGRDGRDAIAASFINSVLAGGTTSPAVTGTITFTVFGPRPPPRPPAPPGAPRWARPRSTGNATYNPTAGYTPTLSATYWWYASYGGDANNNAATSTCGSAMSETVVGLGLADGDGERSGHRHRRDRHHDGQHHLDPRRAPRARTPRGTITFKVFGPQTTAPTTCTTGGTTVGTGHGHTATPPTTRRPATRRPRSATCWWYASYNGDTNNNAATSTCGSGDVRDGRGPGHADGHGERPWRPAPPGPPSRRATSPRPSPLRRARTPPAPSPSRSSALRPTPRPPAPPGAPRWARPRSHGNATYTSSAGYTPTAAGNYWWYASYSGDANNNAATSSLWHGGMSDPRQWWPGPRRR